MESSSCHLSKIYLIAKKPNKIEKRPQSSCMTSKTATFHQISKPNNFDKEPSEESAEIVKQLDKRQRIDLLMKKLYQSTSASNIMEAFNLINHTLIEIEDEHAPKSTDTLFFHSKK